MEGNNFILRLTFLFCLINIHFLNYLGHMPVINWRVTSSLLVTFFIFAELQAEHQ